MSAVAIELRLPSQQYQELTVLASSRRLSVAEAAELAVKEWLERQARLERARALMRVLGKGLGAGPSSNDIARSHDTYLYMATMGFILAP